MKPPVTTRAADLPLLEALAPRRRATQREQGSRSWPLACLAVDAAMLATAVALAEVGARAAGFATLPLLWVGAFPLLVLALLFARGMYAQRLRLEFLEDARRIVSATAVAAMALISAEVVIASNADVALHALRPWVFATVFLVAGHAGLIWSETRARRRGEAGLPTLVIGAGRIGCLVTKRLLQQPELGLRPIGFLDKQPLGARDAAANVPVLGASWDLERVVAAQGVQHVVIAFSTAPNEVLLDLVRRCEALGLGVSFVPRLFEKMTQRTFVEHVGGLPLLTALRPDLKGVQFATKYVADRVAAVFLIVLAAPVLVAAALAVLVSLGRPILYRQTRVGRDGVEFEMLKLRTMKTPVPEKTPDVALLTASDVAPGGVEGSDRRTRLGTLLRRSSVDELPQLFNVLRGQMSLVGPRPERPEFADFFAANVYRYGERHRVKAGITGWAQVHGLRGKTSLSDRVEWDNYYIENWSLWLDVKILLVTLLAVTRVMRQVE